MLTEFNQIQENILNGSPILIYSNEEEETSILVAAEFLNEDTYREMRKYATGDVAVMLGKDIAEYFGMPFLSDALELYAQQDGNVQRAVKSSHAGPTFDLKDVHTGSADLDKVRTINRFAQIVKEEKYPNFFHEFVIPGHVRTYLARPGLLDERIGHTEMGVFISKYFGLSGVVCLITLKNIETGIPLTKEEAHTFGEKYNYPIIYEDDIIELFKTYDKTPETQIIEESSEYLENFEKLLLIRKFEENLEELFRAGKIRGSYHLSIGQEATGVALGRALKTKDAVFLTHRGHHVAIGMGIDIEGFFKECIGSIDGLNGGRGGPMHFTAKDNGIWMANGIVAANSGIAAGVAMAFKKDLTDNVVVNVIGEGSLDEGVAHEVLNLAALWDLPLITICENNLYSQSTKLADHIPVKNISDRISHGYGILCEKISMGTDLVHLTNRLQDIVEWVRINRKPVFVEIMTYRTSGHSMSDKDQKYKDSEIDKLWKSQDPIELYKKYLLDNKFVNEEKLKLVINNVENKISQLNNEI